mgnify:CR=1 FL=1
MTGSSATNFCSFCTTFSTSRPFYIEALTKFVFVLLTCACIFVGFLLLFGKIEYYGYFGATFGQSTFLYGLGLMILGPLVLRVTYEFVMMAILLVQNVIAINRKLKVQISPRLPRSGGKGRRSRRAGSSGERGGRSSEE